MLEAKEVFVGYYKGIDILQGVSVRARENEITAVLGPNGVGKSTLLKTIYGFLKPNKGKIVYNGEDITGIDPYEVPKRGIAYIPQRQNVFPYMTVEENLQLGAWTFKRDKKRIKTRLEEIYNRFPILKERRKMEAGLLSGGEQRMVEIGRALMTNPNILLIDEPTAGLAPKVARAIYDVLKMLKEEGRTILLVDQNIRQAVENSDYVYALELGKNKVEGPKENFDDLKEMLWV
jgi:branched-chain amino acid transport system ATP-binding protein